MVNCAWCNSFMTKKTHEVRTPFNVNFDLYQCLKCKEYTTVRLNEKDLRSTVNEYRK